jgi:hypothetical protein
MHDCVWYSDRVNRCMDGMKQTRWGDRENLGEMGEKEKKGKQRERQRSVEGKQETSKRRQVSARRRN